MARVIAALFLAGSGLIVAGILLPHPAQADVTAFAVVAVISLAAGALMLALGERLPPLGFELAVALGSVLITTLIWLRRDFPVADSAPMELGYVWAVLYSSYFFSRRVAGAQIALALAGYAAALAATSSPVAVISWLVVAFILVVGSFVVFALHDRSEREILARHQAAEELERSLSLLQATLDSTADGILVVDLEGRIVSYNRKFAQMWRIPGEILESGRAEQARTFVIDQLSDPATFLGKIEELAAAPQEESFDVIEFKDGRVFERYFKPQKLGDETVGRVWSFRDVTERRRFVERLQRLADHDPLTRLFNRRRFEEECAREVAFAQRYDHTGALLIVDLDNFKFVNDAHGHACGDQVIREVAAIMTGSLRSTDIVARLGGDEFAVLLRRADTDHAAHAAEDLADAIREHRFAFQGQRLRVTASVGVVPFGVYKSEGPGETLMIDADLAMYAAKEAGRDQVVMHEPDSEEGLLARRSLDWSRRIRKALDEDGFMLYAQPILDLERDEVTQYELLLRMRGSEGEAVPPGAFLGIAERLALVQEIDRWTTREAIRLIERIGPASELKIAVNLSGRSMGHPELPLLIAEELERSAVDPRRLVFELTETAAIANMDRANAFAETLRGLGCLFALDDFGAGFGSFYYLKHLPVDFVKIDGDFVRNLPSNPTDQIVVSSMVDIAKALEVGTIAEFVRDSDTIEALRGFGVDYAQGSEIGMPEPLDSIFEGGGGAGAQPSRSSRSEENPG